MRRSTATLLLAAFVPLSCTSGVAGSPEASGTPTATVPQPEPSVVPGPPGSTPTGGSRPRFAGRVWRLPSSLIQEMRGSTWKPGCPVPLADLRLLRFTYWSFDDEVKRGPMVVHEDVAEDVLWVFGRLFKAGFPIKRVALTREFVPEGFEPRISSSRSVTASFNCRPVITPLGPGDDYSQHSFGLAVDVNPVQNPFVTADGFVRNRMSRPYLDRSKRLTGMINRGDVVVRSFAAIGWSWGGEWSSGKDYMHFSQSGG